GVGRGPGGCRRAYPWGVGQGDRDDRMWISIDECRGALGKALLDEHRRTRDADTVDDVGLLDAAPGRTLRTGGHLAAREHGRQQVRQRCRVWQLELGGPAG